MEIIHTAQSLDHSSKIASEASNYYLVFAKNKNNRNANDIFRRSFSKPCSLFKGQRLSYCYFTKD